MPTIADMLAAEPRCTHTISVTDRSDPAHPQTRSETCHEILIYDAEHNEWLCPRKHPALPGSALYARNICALGGLAWAA